LNEKEIGKIRIEKGNNLENLVTAYCGAVYFDGNNIKLYSQVMMN